MVFILSVFIAVARSTESHLLRRHGCSENRGLLFVGSVFDGTGPTHMPENRQKRSERFRLSHSRCHGDDPLMTDRGPVAHFAPCAGRSHSDILCAPSLLASSELRASFRPSKQKAVRLLTGSCTAEGTSSILSRPST